MNPHLLLAGAGLLAGAMNAVAGGGSFVSFPALVFAGVPSVAANASSTVALFPGAFFSAWAYRDDFRPFERTPMRILLMVSVAGGMVGALLLLFTPQRTFDAVIPWLLLLGTLAFALGRHAGAWLRGIVRIGPAILLGGQFLLAVYGGYFGGAVGLMMMAAWTLFGAEDLRALNAAKTLLVGATNTVAAACFVAAGEVRWPQTALMAAMAALGGHAGARIGRRIPLPWLRLGISVVNAAMTALFFWRAS